MGNVLDEVTDDSIDAAYVQRRVDDWEKRVKALYATLRTWLPRGWSARDGEPVHMHEEMMRRSEVPGRRMPTLVLAGDNGKSVVLAPRALWIVGANGRVDMRGGGRHYLLIDAAGSFEAPQWQASRIERRRDREPLTESWFRQALP